MKPEELQEIRERCEKATPGPWYWNGVKSHKTIDLLTVRNGHQRVMGFARWGLGEAAPVFRTENGMERADVLAIPRQKHRPDGEFLSLNHPDAEFIANARADIPALLDEVTRLKEFAEWIASDAPPHWSDKARQLLNSNKRCICYISNSASLSCPEHGLDSQRLAMEGDTK